jgi:hypothetical protein
LPREINVLIPRNNEKLGPAYDNKSVMKARKMPVGKLGRGDVERSPVRLGTPTTSRPRLLALTGPPGKKPVLGKCAFCCR